MDWWEILESCYVEDGVFLSLMVYLKENKWWKFWKPWKIVCRAWVFFLFHSFYLDSCVCSSSLVFIIFLLFSLLLLMCFLLFTWVALFTFNDNSITYKKKSFEHSFLSSYKSILKRVCFVKMKVRYLQSFMTPINLFNKSYRSITRFFFFLYLSMNTKRVSK